MVKLSTASIRLVQKKNRMNKVGEYPIYIVVCFGGRTEKATGVSCLERHWDSRREVIKAACPNSAVLNKMLSDIKQKVIDRKNELEYNGRVYTPSMLLEDCKVEYNGKSNVYVDVMNRLITDRRLQTNTKRRYEYGYKKLVEYIGRKDFIIDELNVGFIKDFCRWLDVSDCTKRDICAGIASVWNYAIDKKLVDAGEYPFNEFKFTQKFKDGVRDYCIDLVNIKKLKEYWLNLINERDGGLWHYRDGALNRLHKRTSKEFGICWFLACFYLNGSAPTDVARLRVADCSRIMIDGVDYWKVEFKRKKTDSVVNVRLKRDMFSIILLEHFLGFSGSDGYVYPVIGDAVGDAIQRRVKKYGNIAIKWVREAFEEINEETIKRNVSEGLEEPLVDCDKVVLYTARHSFASAYLNSEGATVRGAASLLSRFANTISVYIHALQNDKDIADAVSFLDD
jgi:hypothetical protein